MEVSWPEFGTVPSTLKGFQYQIYATNSIEPGQTGQTCRLVWLYTGGKGQELTVNMLEHFSIHNEILL
jgi:hypothetical protein